jgi:hypothetical protein
MPTSPIWHPPPHPGPPPPGGRESLIGMVMVRKTSYARQPCCSIERCAGVCCMSAAALMSA